MKVSDLGNVENVPTHICYVDNRPRIYGQRDTPAVLHLTRRIGYKYQNSAGRWCSYHTITDCNRVLGHDQVYTRDALPDEEDGDYKLCTRCGTREDFAKVLVTHHERLAQSRAKCHAEREARDAALETRYKMRQEALVHFQRQFADDTVSITQESSHLVVWTGNTAYKVTVIQVEGEPEILGR